MSTRRVSIGYRWNPINNSPQRVQAGKALMGADWEMTKTDHLIRIGLSGNERFKPPVFSRKTNVTDMRLNI